MGPRYLLNARRGVFGYYAIYFVCVVQYFHGDIFDRRIFQFFFPLCLIIDCSDIYILFIEKDILIMTHGRKILLNFNCQTNYILTRIETEMKIVVY